MTQLFGEIDVRSYGDKEFVVHNTALRTRLAQRVPAGLRDRTRQRRCPTAVRTGGHKPSGAFLSALFDGDGWIDPTSDHRAGHRIRADRP